MRYTPNENYMQKVYPIKLPRYELQKLFCPLRAPSLYAIYTDTNSKTPHVEYTGESIHVIQFNEKGAVFLGVTPAYYNKDGDLYVNIENT
jgi:hypothetical protein